MCSGVAASQGRYQNLNYWESGRVSGYYSRYIVLLLVYLEEYVVQGRNSINICRMKNGTRYEGLAKGASFLEIREGMRMEGHGGPC